jgi:hypothetical protein
MSRCRKQISTAKRHWFRIDAGTGCSDQSRRHPAQPRCRNSPTAGISARRMSNLPKKIIAACKVAGVRRLVHMSALGANPEAPSEYLASKGEGEALVMAAKSELDVTVFRPSVIFGLGDSFLSMFASVLRKVPFFPLGFGHAASSRSGPPMSPMPLSTHWAMFPRLVRPTIWLARRFTPCVSWSITPRNCWQHRYHHSLVRRLGLSAGRPDVAGAASR